MAGEGPESKRYDTKAEASMRILQLAKYYWPHSGGMERVVQDLAEGAAELGHEVEVIAYESGPPAVTGRQRSHVTRVFSFGAVGAQELAPGYFAAAQRRADIVHLHHPHPLADAALLLRMRRQPVVVTQHADSRRATSRMLSRAVLRRAAAIVVPSRAHVAISTELVGLEPKIEVIPFGIDVHRWEDLELPDDRRNPRAIFIGRLVRYKGLDVLLRAMEHVPELQLDVVGAGPEGPRLQTLSRALAIQDRVRFLGEYPDEDLPRRMADADFLVLPSVTVEEMFGLVVLEAMAAGRPVITTAVPSAVREVNVPGTTGIEVPIRDIDALAGALATLARDPGLRQRMGAAGRNRVREQFTRERMVEDHIALYRRVAGGS